MSTRKGFVFTLTALTLFLIMISYSFMILYNIRPLYAETSSDFSLNEEIYRSILIGAGAAASRSADPESAAELYIETSLNAIAKLPQTGLQLPKFNGTGTGKREPYSGDLEFGVIYKSYPGTGASTITVLNLPPESEAVLADRCLNIISKSTTGLLSFNGLTGDYYLIVYTKDSKRWYYSGIVSTSYKYFIQGGSLTSSTWSSPAGFPYLLVYGVPQLGLVRVFDGTGTLICEALKEPWSNVTTVLTPYNTLSGVLSVISPKAWYFGLLEGGEVFTYG